MSSLTSSSTLAEIQASYIDNASYAEDGSVAKAKAFITACRVLLLKMPKSSNSREAGATYNSDLILKEMEAAQAWVAANDSSPTNTSGGPSVSRLSFENFR